MRTSDADLYIFILTYTAMTERTLVVMNFKMRVMKMKVINNTNIFANGKDIQIKYDCKGYKIGLTILMKTKVMKVKVMKTKVMKVKAMKTKTKVMKTKAMKTKGMKMKVT